MFVPFAMEDGGTLGAHALALLKLLAEFAVSRGCFCSPDSRAPLTAMPQCRFRFGCSAGSTAPVHLLAPCYPLPAADAHVWYHPDGALSAVLS